MRSLLARILFVIALVFFRAAMRLAGVEVVEDAPKLLSGKPDARLN